MLAARQLAFARAGHAVFRGIDLTLDAGHALAVTGPNGSGKSTLLRVLAGLLPPATGELTWAGRPVRAGDPVFGQSVGYVGHANGIDPDLSATEHLVYAARLAGCAVTAEAARAALAEAGLGRVADAAVRTLSQGQRRRVALARLSLVPRTLWLLDEPLTSLDDDAAARFTQQLDAHLASGGMAVVATHRPLLLAHGATATLCLGGSA